MNMDFGDTIRNNLQEIFDSYDDIRDEDVMEYDIRSEIADNNSFKLYRFMPADYYNIRNLEKQMIHLSANGRMNDIYEGIPASHIDATYNAKTIKALGNLAYMTCFTEHNDNYLMWSHYADDHKGFCIEYDVKKLKSDPLEITKHLFPVLYSTDRLSDDINTLIQDVRSMNEALNKGNEYDGEYELDYLLPRFLKKNPVWKYENEWRIVYTINEMYKINDNVLYSQNIPFPCVSGIYLGTMIEKVKAEHICEIAGRLNREGSDIKVYETVLDAEEYRLLFNEVSID